MMLRIVVATYMETLKTMLEENNKQMESMLRTTKGPSQAEDKLDQEGQKIKIIELERPQGPMGEEAASVCGSWIHRIRPTLKNVSKRSDVYWTKLEEMVQEGYQKFLSSKPIDRINFKFPLNKDLDKEEYSKVKAVVKEMILKAIPKELTEEATQRRYESPEEIMLMIMVKYQPGSPK